MAKIKGKRVMAKLIGMKSTSVWLTKEQQEIAKHFNVTNQEFAQCIFDTAMGFVVNISMKENIAKVIDPIGNNPIDDELAQILADEIVRKLRKGDAE